MYLNPLLETNLSLDPLDPKFVSITLTSVLISALKIGDLEKAKECFDIPTKQVIKGVLSFVSMSDESEREEMKDDEREEMKDETHQLEDDEQEEEEEEEAEKEKEKEKEAEKEKEKECR